MNARLKIEWMTLLVAGLASASAPAMSAVTTLPAEQHQGSVGFITGGVGEQEAKLFERQQSKHPLTIELLERSGKTEEFTANAKVRIADAHGHTVLNAKAEGPFMLVDLSPGRYSIVATLKQDTLKKTAVIASHGKPAHATFEFPAHTD